MKAISRLAYHLRTLKYPYGSSYGGRELQEDLKIVFRAFENVKKQIDSVEEVLQSGIDR